jgi:hypothetical protein
MKKKSFIGIGLCVVVLFLGTLSTVIGYQSADSNDLSDSPLFRIGLQRTLHQQRNMIASHYLGERDDTTPPVTLCVLDPPEPDGENGWYVSKINVTLIAADDGSGVNITEYKIDNGTWQTYFQPFTIATDSIKHFVKYYSVDNAGNKEQTKNVTFALDQTKPVIDAFEYDVTSYFFCGWFITWYLTAHDDTSGLNRAEFFINEELQITITGQGPIYVWDQVPSFIDVRGFIRDPEITPYYVKFYAKIVKISGENLDPNNNLVYTYVYDTAGNRIKETVEMPTFHAPIKPGFYARRHITLPNNYTGFIGKNFIYAQFNNKYRGYCIETK